MQESAALAYWKATLTEIESGSRTVDPAITHYGSVAGAIRHYETLIEDYEEEIRAERTR